MNLLLLNQYVPPDAAPTARLLGRLEEFLRGQGHKVEFLGDRRDYRSRPAGQGGGGARLVRELRAAWQILWAGFFHRRQRGSPADVVLALSSPPLALVLAALIAWRHNAKLVHWAMDLYPEVALALSPHVQPGIFARLLTALMRAAYRRAVLVVALDDDMRAHLERTYGIRDVRVLPPWPPTMLENLKKSATSNATAAQDGNPWRWLYSGNLGRAHEWETLLEAQRILEARGLPVELIFQGGGNARDVARERARMLGLRQCRWETYVEEIGLLPSLLAARMLIVTQRPETRGLLWPSKLAVISRLPRPVLFVGPTDGAIAAELRARPQTGVFAPRDAASVADWIHALYHETEIERGDVTNARGDVMEVQAAIEKRLAAVAEAGCQLWASWLAEVMNK